MKPGHRKTDILSAERSIFSGTYRKRNWALYAAFGMAFALAGCGSLSGSEAKEAEEKAKPAAKAGALPDAVSATADNSAAAVQTGQDEQLGTPMAERIATIGFLNKRNNKMRELKMKPGEAQRIGNVVVRMEACERTAPWETPAESGAFVQVLVQDKQKRNSNEKPKWRRIFSGWLFKESPSVNVVEHPIYDVWVKNCAMRFPGEEEIIEDVVADSDAPDRPARTSSSDDSDTGSATSESTSRSSASANEGSASERPARPSPSAPAAQVRRTPTLPEPTIDDLLDEVDE